MTLSQRPNAIPESNGFDNIHELIEGNNLHAIEEIIISAKIKYYKNLWYLEKSIKESVEKAICRAIEPGRIDVVKVFLKHELYPNLHIYYPTQFGHVHRLIELAAVSGSLSIVKLLFEDFNADISTENYNGRADVHIMSNVVKSGNTFIVEYLLQAMKSKEVSLREEELGEILSQAAQKNNIPMVGELTVSLCDFFITKS